MLEQQINDVLSQYNETISTECKIALLSVLSSDPKTQLDTLDKTIYDSPVNLVSSVTWSPTEENATTVQATTETLNFKEEEEQESPNPEERSLNSIGRYDDLGELGVGGMGEVRKIRDRTLNRTLAMKIIHQKMLTKHNVTARFIEEAQIGAQLQHPNIVPIHEMGRLNDGRLYFTMKEVRGRPFGEAIDEVHQAVENDRWRITSSGWSFRRLVDSFNDVCKAVAYAHSKGVLHRDLKPENIMLGEYGEVLVVDWGIAKVLGRRDYAAEAGDLDVVSTDRSKAGANATRIGQVAGTPAYMSPEQARGQIDKLDGRTDVYALGAILYEILRGKAAYEGNSGLAVLKKVLSGPPQSIRTTSGSSSKDTFFFDDIVELEVESKSGLPLPEELIVACEKAMSRSIEARYSSVQAFADVISDWLDGAKKREQALKVTEAAIDLTQKREELEKQSNLLLEEAEAGLKDIPLWESESVKGEWWEKERKAQELSQQSQLLDIAQEQQLQGALTHKADLEEAHVELARRYRTAHEQAEIEREPQEVAKAEVRLREHAGSLPDGHPQRIEHFHYLKGTGALSLLTDVDDVEVILEKYVPHHRRLVPKVIANLGKSPVISHSLEIGSYRLRLRKEGHHEVLYPVSIGRGEHWNGVDPTGIQRPVHLPKLGVLGENDCYVPGGWFWAGGDKQAARSLSRRRVWVDSVVMKKFPVTNREYLVFLEDLVTQGREQEALLYVPRERAGQAGQQGAMIYGRKSNGGFELVPDADGDMWDSDYPVCMVDWHCAAAYGAWMSKKSGLPWRLPHELEWEKAAKGVDGRFFVWGDGFDPSYGCMRQSHPGRVLPVGVDGFPIDESVYGVRGMAGNMSDWTASVWSEDWSGIAVENDVLLAEPSGLPSEISTGSKRVNRGGNWNNDPDSMQASYRNFYSPTSRSSFIGFRLGLPL